MKLLQLPNIPVPFTIDITVSHIITINFRNFNAAFLNVSFEVVLSFFFYFSEIKPSVKLVFLVVKLGFTLQLMPHCSEKSIAEQVTEIVVTNTLTIFEANLFPPW